MKTEDAPHEKLTDIEIKEVIENLLRNHLKLKNRWDASDWEVHEFDEFIKNQEGMIFKLRRHFSPELTKILKVSVKELSEMIEPPKYPAMDMTVPGVMLHPSVFLSKPMTRTDNERKD